VDGSSLLTVDDYERAAGERLPPDVWAYIAGGAGDERTLAENRRAFERYVLRPRFLRGAHEPDLGTEVLGERISMPILVGPWAYQRIAHPDGELATARASAEAGTVMVVSSTAVEILEDVARASAVAKWWQLYLAEDRGFTEQMLARLVAAGYRAIVWTVDLPAYGLRHREARHDFVPEFGLAGSEYVYDLSITWDDLGWIRERADGLPILVKGLLTAEDARLAVGAGADGIVVSNHGGRQLDRSPAALDALPEVADAVAGSIPVLIDGGVRRGVDVVTALALGASAVLVGRPAAYGLAADGESGVAAVLGILRDELRNAMALCGCRSVAEIGPALVARAPV
jgi:isopentenyl diphosphate isomerase/L-lactate dehydrogenase-like FMN-dependent dehydrogenase